MNQKNKPPENDTKTLEDRIFRLERDNRLYAEKVADLEAEAHQEFLKRLDVEEDLIAELRYWRRDAALRLWNARTLLGTHERFGDEEKAYIRRDTIRTTLAALDEIAAKAWGEPDEIADDLAGQVALARAALSTTGADR